MSSQAVRRPGRASKGEKIVLCAEAFPVSTARRCLDVVVASLLLLLVSPLLLALATLILVTDGRPVLYRQVRIGEGGRPFELLKLRSMRAGSQGAEVTATGDPRITPLGRFLRRSSADELPQLWHVLRGQMTLVGPRPETEALARRYPIYCRPVLAARPGLTGPTQLRYREASASPPDDRDIEQWYLGVLVPLRVQSDLEYLEHPTPMATLRYLWLTALFVVGLVDVPTACGPSATAGAPLSRRSSGRTSA